MSPARRRLALVVAGLLFSLGSAGAWWLLSEEPVEPEVAEAEELDPSREETEDLMRKIGYVQ